MPATNPTLTQLLNTHKGRLCSIELSCQNPIDWSQVQSMKFSFISIIWMGDYDGPAEEVPPITVAKEAIARGYTVVLHFPGRNTSKKSCFKILDYAKCIGIRNLLCIRGASPECQFEESKYDFPYSTDLIKFVKSKYGDYFDICVPGYPYKHPESKDLAEDMKYLKNKNDAGAKFIISQAAFSYDIYKEFLLNCRKYDITMQIIPGVYIIRSVVDFCLLKKLCKVPSADPAVQFIKEHKGKDEEIAAYGMKVSYDVVKSILQDRDFCPPHIYTMNEFDTIREFLAGLKMDK